MKINFLPMAQKELDEAFAWYEKQAVGLGNEFLDELDQSLRLVLTYPQLQPLVAKNIRRCLLNRFPYSLLYGISDNTIIVVAVAHLKRKPEFWIQRS